MDPAMFDVLLLNADYSPVRVLDWQRAVCMLLDDKVMSVADYSGRHIRSTSLVLPWPAVITLRRYAKHRGRMRFNRTNLLARDAYTCQYCGYAPRNGQGQPVRTNLTMDHVVPRALSVGGQVTLPWSGLKVPVSSWENLTTACRSCNQRKAARLPEQARMTLGTKPRRPSNYEGVQLMFTRRDVPEEWKDFLPLAA
ncbi:MAG: 5-methylcytosine-specific restriction endonuclease McrA [Cognaticolwellia sp.]|jgi:5-methylcytosine-specific restriction endonuclease McrA